MTILWRSGYIHDWGTEEVLQCYEEAWLKETSETHTQTPGTSLLKGDTVLTDLTLI